MYDLERFIKAQHHTYEQVVSELSAGKKCSHWMWYIFPQIAGLGRSMIAQHYALKSLDEANEYLNHFLLGRRIRECTGLVLDHSGMHDACHIFGTIDSVKFCSSMTLFSLVESETVFTHALELFFADKPDQLTLKLVGQR